MEQSLGKSSHPFLVMKFGGTSVASLDRMRRAAERVAIEVAHGYQVAVVVSAMGGTTDELVAQATDVGPSFDAREYDVLVSAGEQISAALMAMALQQAGVVSRSWMGWQLPLRTDGRHSRASIVSVGVEELRQRKDMVAVCAGFQGVDERGRITTLGRGGSDTSAVALAVALNAVRCDIYTDVDGVYTCDPRVVPGARRLQSIDAEEMLEMASLGAKVLHARAVQMALYHRMPLRVLSSLRQDDNNTGTWVVVRNSHPDQLVPLQAKEGAMEAISVTGIAMSHGDALITVTAVHDQPGVVAEIFSTVAEAGVDVDMIIQSSSTAPSQRTDVSFTVEISSIDLAVRALESLRTLENGGIQVNREVVKISVVGVGMRSNPGVAHRIFDVLGKNAINIAAISTSEIKVSMLIDGKYAELAARLLHQAFDLDQEEPEKLS